jgi:hypothetical protein
MPKFLCLLFKLMLDFDSISIGRAQGRDVQKLYFGLDVSMQSTRCRFEPLIPGLVCKVWKIFVNYDTA